MALPNLIASALRMGLAWALALAMAAALSGCVVIPTPEFNSGNARSNITRKTPRQFEVGSSTRADVVLALGEPDGISPDEHQIAYRSEKVWALWAIGGQGAAASGAFYKDRYLIMSFDEQGVLHGTTRATSWFDPRDSVAVTAEASRKLGVAQDASPAMVLCVDWLQGIDAGSARFTALIGGPPGWLKLGEGGVAFTSTTEAANSEAVWSLTFDAIESVRVGKRLLGCFLVIKSKERGTESFRVLGPKRHAVDRQATRAACDFIQARLKPTPSVTDGSLPASAPR